MLINLSNHPSNTWTKDQKSEAKIRFGDVIDIKFPIVDPRATVEQVVQLGKETLFNAIRQYHLNPKDDVVFHVMGEATFCHYFIKYGLKLGFKFVVSTTERYDGFENRYNFRFISFRELD